MSKTANLIVVGGTIAAGKSTLVDGIAKVTGWVPVPELREGDKVQEIILEKLYEGKNRIHLATVQYYFLANRYKQYKESCGGLITSILDRAIWEDWFFAKLLMVDEPKSYEHFKELWKTTLEKIVFEYGKPKVYIYAKVNWESFKERIFLRNRETEIKNFEANKEYFKNLLDLYTNDFENLLEEHGIPSIVIETDTMSKEEVVNHAIKELKQKNLF